MFGALSGGATTAGPGTTSGTTTNPNGERKSRKMHRSWRNWQKSPQRWWMKLRIRQMASLCLNTQQEGWKSEHRLRLNTRVSAIFLDSKGVEFYTFNPNPAQQVKFILRGLHTPMDINEILAGLSAEGAEVSHARQIKQNTIEDGTRVVTLHPMWVITITKTTEDVNKFKNITRLNNFFLEFNITKHLIEWYSVSSVKNLGTKHNFVISRTNVFNVQVYIIPETVQRMLHTLPGVWTVAGNTPLTFRGALRLRNLKKGGVPLEPPPSLNQQGGQMWPPEMNSRSCLADSELSNLLQKPLLVVDWKTLERS